MQEQESGRVLRVDLTQGVVAGLIIGLVLVTAFAYLALGERRVEASEAAAPRAMAPQVVESSTAPRRYYLTALNHKGNDVITACIDGFHAASIWELMDVSNLDYAIDLTPAIAEVRADDGEGPPSGYVAWARTGHNASTSNTAGQANCAVWTSDSNLDYGTVAALPMDWINDPSMSIWWVDAETCDTYCKVWCLED